MKLTTKTWARIERRIYQKPSGCHGWAGCTDSAGFPTSGDGHGGNVKVHRELFFRAHPAVDVKGWCIIQKCLDRGCLNVSHMLRMKKADADTFRDPAARRSKRINWDLVHRIRRMSAGANMAQVARDHGIAQSTARRIRNNTAWRE